MSDHKAQNTFLEGVKGDYSPMDASSNAATDVVNGGFVSGKENQMILQNLKSNVPLLSEQIGEEIEVEVGPSTNTGHILASSKSLLNLDVRISYGNGLEATALNIDLYSSFDALSPFETINLPFSGEARGQKINVLTKNNLTEDKINRTKKVVVRASNNLQDINITTTFCITYLRPEAPEKLPTGRQIFGLKEHNDIAYIISGKPTEVQGHFSDQNDKAPKHPISIGAYDDDRDLVDNFTQEEGVSVSYDKVSQNLIDTKLGDAGILTTTTYEPPFILVKDVYDYIFTPGRHTGNIQLISNFDTYASKAYTHKVRFRFVYKKDDGTDYVVRDWEEVSRYGQNNINETFILDFNIDESIWFEPTQEYIIDNIGTESNKGSLRVELDYEVATAGRGKIDIYVKTHITDPPPPSLSVDAPIKPNPLVVTPATSKLHRDGSIQASVDRSADGTDTFYFFARNYFNFINSGVGGSSATFDNLAPGDYTIYTKRAGDGVGTFVYKETVRVGVANELENIIGNVEVRNFNGLGQPFDLAINFEDPCNLYDGSYKVGYNYFNGEDFVEGSSQIVSDRLDSNQFITLNASFDEEASVICYIETYNDHSISGELMATDKKRRCEVEVPITQKLEQNKYDIEVGTFPSPNYAEGLKGKLIDKYSPLQNLDGGSFLTNKITLTGKNYLDIELQDSYDGSVNIFFADKGRKLRLVNSGFSVLPDNKFEVVERNGANNTNRYYEKSVEVATRAVQSLEDIPVIEVSKINSSGGNLEVGSYKLYFALGNPDGNLTEIVEESGNIPIFAGDTIGSVKGGSPGSSTNKSIEFEISEVSDAYDHLKVFYVLDSGKDVNNTLAYSVDKKFYFNKNSGTSKFTLTGQEPRTVINEAQLSEKRSQLSSVGSITQIQNRLFAGNVGTEKVDYNKLFKAIQNVVAIPSIGTRSLNLSNFYGAWNYRFLNSPELYNFSKKYTSNTIEISPFSDINKAFQGGLSSNIIAQANEHGFHNPLIAEKLQGFWPNEPYKLAMCLVLDDDTVTAPIPVSSGDFSSTPSTSNEFNLESSRYDNVKDAGFSSASSWVGPYNNIGVIRFPQPKNNTSLYYPKFKFKKSEIIKEYPELFSRAKGFFFVRAERKSNVIMTAEIGHLFKAITENHNLDDPTDQDSLTLNDILPEALSAVPFMLSSVQDTDSNSSYIRIDGKEDMASAVINNVELIKNIKNDFFKFKESLNGSSEIHKYALRSGDLFTDKERVAGSFNGANFGIKTIGQFYTEILEAETNASSALKAYLGTQKLTNKTANEESKVVKAFFDYVKYNTQRRSGGGFSSHIPYKAYRENDFEFMSGVFEDYLGASSEEEFISNYGFIYPGDEGPMSLAALKNMYNSDESTEYKAITPRYSFDDFKNDEIIDIIGTRGDCYISQSVVNISHGDVPPIGSPTSRRFDLKDVDTNEHNSYRALEVGTSSLLTQHSDYLTFLRHPEVEDPVESALYQKARGFYPLDGNAGGTIAPGASNRMPSTSGFNKGFKNHFTGKKYISVSKDSPYISRENQNTVKYTSPHVSGQFFNSYRVFNSLDSKEYGRDFGAIRRMMNYNNSLLMVHDKGVSSVGVNDQTFISSEEGVDVRMDSVNVLPEKERVISSEFGSTWPRSVRRTDNTVYGVDASRNKIWRVAGEGLQIISSGAVNRQLNVFLKGFEDREEVPGELFIATHYDTINNDVIFSFYNKDSKVTERSFEMDPDLFEMIDSFSEEELDRWLNMLDTPTNGAEASLMLRNKLSRKQVYEVYQDIITSSVVKGLTLVYNENTNMWTTRLSYTPEFLFNSGSSMYTVNPIDSLNSSSNLVTTKLEQQDKSSHLFWKHAAASKYIPSYGSFFGQKPRFELEFIINDNTKFEKILEELHIVGNQVMPDEIIYQVSEDAPWMRTIIDTSSEDYGSWINMESDYYNKALDSSFDSVNPARYFSQEMRDRRTTSILRANYSYELGYNRIFVGKGLSSMYDLSLPDAPSIKHFISKLRDKYFRVRLVYNSEKYINIKAVTSNYKISI